MRRKFTDLFIRKPVLAIVVSLFVFLLGLRALFELPIQQYPTLESSMITVTTAYPGANADMISGFITTPLEQSLASTAGLDYMTSSSVSGLSTINLFIKLNYSSDSAFTSAMSKVAQVRNKLPANVQDPVINQSAANGPTALMYLSFNSSVMSPEKITDYLTRVVQPKVEAVSGVSQAQILGGAVFAMRIWLDPNKMAAYGVTAEDINNALLQNNYQAAPGNTTGTYTAVALNTNTTLETPEEFSKIIIFQKNNAIVRLGDVATVKLGAQTYNASVQFNGKKAVFMAITATPDANPLTVITQVRQLLPSIQAALPEGLKGNIVYDATNYIRASIDEVVQTLIEATFIVVLIILLFLGSFRTVVIPMITIPLSLVGVCTFMLAMGYSINLLTLLAMVLAIGMVVDDAIVVVENIYRHIEEGMKPIDAAIKGAREIAMPVISMTITLAAVYAPIGLMSGITGALFTEFAFTLAGTVVISGFVALTLSPMMCSRFFTLESSHTTMVQLVDRQFDKFRQFYQRRLHSTLETPSVIVLLAVAVLGSCYFFYSFSQKELAPTEDQGIFFVIGTGPQYANIDYTKQYADQINQIYAKNTDISYAFTISGFSGVNTLISGALLLPWNERTVTQAQVLAKIQPQLNQVAGLQTMAFPLPALPTGSNSNFGIDFVITSTADFQTIKTYSDQILKDALKSGLFIFLQNGLRFENPQITFTIDHDKAEQLGISMKNIADALTLGMGGNYVNLFELGGRSYQVIPQLLRKYRGDVEQIQNLQVRTNSGSLVPLSTVVHFSKQVTPDSLTHFSQLNSAELQGVPMPGHTVGEGLAFLQKEAKNILPHTMMYDYEGSSRQFVTEGNSLMITFIFSIIVIFLVLSAQFESFRDPFIILISVPMSICGALIPLSIGLASVNIYTQIGLITLIGLISKHGILMVEFANELQKKGMSIREAIEHAASVRLRAIVMTTCAMIVGVVPLILATGAGAVSRFDIGLVIACGMAIGTIFTLFVVPTMYILIAKKVEPEVESSEDVE